VHDEKYPLISHPNDPQFRLLRQLQSARGREQTNQYLIEGIRHVARAHEARAAFSSLFVEPSKLSNPFGQKLARRIRQAGVPQFRIAPHLYRELTLASEPQGIAAILRKPQTSLDAIGRAHSALWLAVESIDQPGNLGTIIRTAEASGAAGIFVLGQGADPWDPACVRATMGALFSLRLIQCSNREFIQWSRTNHVKIVASSPAGLMTFKAFGGRKPMAILIGSEKVGLSEELLEAADFTVRIPMKGQSDSINAAVAAGVLLFQYADAVR